MKILLATSSTGWSGGQHQVYLLAKGLRDRGNTVSVATSHNSELGKRLAAEDVDVHFFRMNKEADIFTMIGMAGFLKRNRFDVINVHRPTAHTIAMIANILSTHARFVVTRRVPYGIPSRISAQIKYEWFVDRVIAISNDVKQSLVSTGVHEQHIAVIPDAIDTGYYGPAQAVPLPGLESKKPVIGTVGNANRQKGHRYFMEAVPMILKKYPGAFFVDVGVNGHDRELVDLAADLGIRDRVLFAGFQPDVRPYLKAMDVFVFPSLVEGLGTSLLEAMSMELPVVVSKTGGMLDVVIHNENGVFVQPGSGKDIADAVCGLLDDRQHARELGMQARTTVGDRFSVPVVAKRTQDLFSTLL